MKTKIRKKKTMRLYSDEEKAAVVVAYRFSGIGCTTLAKQIGVTASSISRWNRGLEMSEKANQIVRDKSKTLLQKCDRITHSILDSINQEDSTILNAKLLERTTAFCQLIDKMEKLKQKEVEMPASEEEIQQELDALIKTIGDQQREQVQAQGVEAGGRTAEAEEHSEES